MDDSGNINLMNERKIVKNRNDIKYKVFHKLINTKIKEAKEKLLQNKCIEMEQLEEKGDTF